MQFPLHRNKDKCAISGLRALNRNAKTLKEEVNSILCKLNYLCTLALTTHCWNQCRHSGYWVRLLLCILQVNPAGCSRNINGGDRVRKISFQTLQLQIQQASGGKLGETRERPQTGQQPIPKPKPVLVESAIKPTYL